MESTTLMELGEHFNAKVEGIRKCIQLRGCVNEVNCQHLLQSVDLELIAAEDLVSQMKLVIGNEKQKLQEAQELMQQYKDLSTNIEYMSTHLPSRLPGKQTASHTGHQKAILQSSQTLSRLENRPVEEGVITAKQNKRKPIYIAKMDYLTMDEFELVPKYMKGRMSYDLVNNVVDGINKVVEYKYKIVAQPRSTVGENNMKKRKEWKKQQTKDSQGLQFFIDDDYRKYSGLKLDKATNQILTILRHCGRHKEIRGGGVTRYCLPSY
ncbi:SKA complex subunit 1-like [Glandiceps talaboti]